MQSRLALGELGQQATGVRAVTPVLQPTLSWPRGAQAVRVLPMVSQAWAPYLAASETWCLPVAVVRMDR